MFRGFEDDDGNIIMDKEYLGHAIFKSLSEAARFYQDLSDNVISFAPKWVKAQPIINYDSYFFESLANSIASIKTILELGHVADAKVLFRNFFDETIVNLYFMARLKKKDDELINLIEGADFLIHGPQPEQLHDVNVSDWLVNNKTKDLRDALRYNDMRDFLKHEASIAGVVEYLYSPECKNIREWLNDAVHLNYYKNTLLNNGQLCIDGERKSAVDKLKYAFDRISMLHVTCVFCLESIYMMSSDYRDYLDCGMKPPEGCQYDVAPFVQSYLDKTVYRAFPDWAEKLIEAAAPTRLSKVEKVDGSENG